MPYIGNTIRAADDYRLIDDISSGFNGSTTSFALQVAGSAPVPFPKSPQQVLISVNGVIQEPDPTGSSGFNLVGTNIVFSSAPTNGHAFFGIIYATADYLNAGGNFPAGSLGAPSITFIGDENSGLFRKSGGSVGFVSDATEIANFDSNGITISSGNLIIPDSIIHGGDTDTKIRFSAANTVSIEVNGSEGFKVDTTGTTLTSTTDASLFVNTTNSNGSHIRLQTSGTTKSFIGQAAGISGSLGNANDLALRSAEDIVFSTNNDNSPNVKIDTNGRLGIGTTSPINPLHVVFTGTDVATFESTDAGSSGSQVSFKHTSASPADNDTIANLTFDGRDDTNAATTYAQLRVITTDVSNNSESGAFQFFTRNAGSFAERLRLNSAGNLIPGADSTHDIGSNSVRFANGYFDTLYGDGSNLTNITTTTINNNANNRVITGSGSANTLEGEANLTFALSGNDPILSVIGANNAGHAQLILQTGGTSDHCSVNFGDADDNDRGEIRYTNSSDSMNFDTAATHRMIIDSNGHVKPATNNTYDLGSSSLRWRDIYTNDLNLSNEGSSNDVDSTWGDYTIQEGYEDLFLINNRTGKKFKFNLTEVS